MVLSRRSWAATALVAGFVTLSVPLAPASAADGLSSLDDQRLASVGGLASDPTHSRYWAVEQGPGRLQIRAFDAVGAPLGPASTLDRGESLQSLAVHGPDVYVGDTGGWRRTVTVWKMTSPVPTTVVKEATAIRLKYPDGAHESHAMFMNSEGQLFLVTKGDDPGVYSAPAQAQEGERATPLERVGDAPAKVSDATMLAGGQVAMRAPGQVLIVDPATWKVTKKLPVPGAPKGAGLAESLSGGAVLASAPERTIVRVPLTEVAGATSTPVPRGYTPSARPTKTQPKTTPEGLVAALAGAGAVALAMSLIALIKR